MSRTVVKHRYFKGKQAARDLKRYINYLTYREEHGLEVSERVFFNKEKQALHPMTVTKFIGPNIHTVAGHELILSPGIQSVDKHRYTRELMAKLGTSLGMELSWVAIQHKGKHNHIHVLIDGDASGKRVRLGREEYRRLREWGDAYLEREHPLERYLRKDFDIDSPFKRDSGDCLFESLFEIPPKANDEKHDALHEPVNHFADWDKSKAIAELPDDEKLYEAGKVYTKFSSYSELASLRNKLRISGADNLPSSQRKNLKVWITEKNEFGDDHHERLAREKYARSKGRAQSNKRLVSTREPILSKSNNGDRKPMLQTNDNKYSSDSINAEKAAQESEQRRLEQEKEIAQRQADEDARLAQVRADEDKLWQAHNRREEEFLKVMESESPDFKEWAEEARRLREMQEQNRAEERKLYDQKVVEIREQERLRQEELDREQEEQDARDLEAEEALKQERREEDERLAQLEKEDEQWRKRENDSIDERAEREEYDREEENSRIQSEDDKARLEEYEADEQRKEQQWQIEKQQRSREYKIQNERETKQFASDCKSSMDKSHSPDSDKGALRYERRPFRQRTHEDKGRHLQWHIRYQNSATRMMLNQQIEAEADAAKKEQLRNQLDELNRGEQEQLKTEIEPVDLDAIANEYVRFDLDEDYSKGRFVDAERSTDPDALSKQWRSPLDSVENQKSSAEGTKDSGTNSDSASSSESKIEGGSKEVKNPGSKTMPGQSFSDKVDKHAEEHWPSQARDDKEDDELGRFLNMDGESRTKEQKMDRQQNNSQVSKQESRQERQTPVFKQEGPSIKTEIKRDDSIFGR